MKFKVGYIIFFNYEYFKLLLSFMSSSHSYSMIYTKEYGIFEEHEELPSNGFNLFF